jgi:hypothetical protein
MLLDVDAAAEPRAIPVSARRRGAKVVAGIYAAVLLSACTVNPYVIGAYAGAADGGAGTVTDGSPTFAASLSRSGTSRLDPSLALPSGSVAASLRLRGEAATPDAWPSDEVPVLTGAAGTATANVEAPFSDATRAVGLAADQPSYAADTPDVGAVEADDAVFELVLRAAPGSVPLNKLDPSGGWSLTTGVDGSLSLQLFDGRGTWTIASEPLVSEAWYYCVFWVTHGAGGAASGRADCDGRQGTLTNLGNLGALGHVTSPTDLTIGGNQVGFHGLTELAYFSLFRAPAGSLDGVDWLSLGRVRFAALTGSLPETAYGTLLPNPGMRGSAAYLDVDRADDAGRHLFLVGPDWPRVACRTDGDDSNGCGYLSEPYRPRLISPDPAAWTTSEVTLVANHALFADGDVKMDALVPSTNATAHVLTETAAIGQQLAEAFSFFVRPEGGRFVGASVSDHGEAIFDLQAMTAVSPVPAGVRALIEPWGGGLVRCAYVFAAEAGPLVYGVHLLNGLNGTPSDVFAGDGTTAWVDIWGMQVDVSSDFPGSLLGADVQAPDNLWWASDGNLPPTSRVAVQLRVLLPAGPRLDDQAVLNLNLGAAAASNQVNLFVTGNAGQPSGQLSFEGLAGVTTYWAVDYPVSGGHSVVDGIWHRVQAYWTPQAVAISVDGVAASWPPQVSPAPFTFDRIDVGFSTSSSGPLAGLVGGLQIGPQ